MNSLFSTKTYFTGKIANTQKNNNDLNRFLSSPIILIKRIELNYGNREVARRDRWNGRSSRVECIEG